MADATSPDHEQAAPPVVDDHLVADLRSRLRNYQAVPLSPGHGWSRGVDHAYLQRLVQYWLDDYDWRVHEHRIRAYPWFHAGAGATAMRGLHLRGHAGSDLPLVLLHGWPDSILRFERLLPLLDDLDVVVPALPGFPFAAPVPSGGMSSAQMAQVVSAAMTSLGYSRYVVSAGDVGCDVAEALAGAHPDRVAALHLTDVSQYRFLVDPPSDLSPEEEAYVEHGRHWQAREGGYMHEQSTKPHTLAAGLGDSPVGLAAWIVEKLRSWTDCGGDLELVFSPDDILTWVSAYWFSRCIGTSFAPYAQSAPKPPFIAAPTVFTIFAHDLVNAPREFAARFFDVADYESIDRGGHFAAWERPDDYLRGVRRALALALA